jgi:hypothetical protein
MNPDVSIVGYGVRLRAAAGAELGRAPSHDDSLVGAWGGTGHIRDRLVSIRDGVASVRSNPDGRIDGFACETDETRRAPAWSVELPQCSCAWPRGLALRVLPQAVEFVDARDGVVFLRGPLRAREVPTPSDLVGADKELVRSDMRPHAMWVEARYEHGGRRWRVRHRYALPTAATVVLVTAKAPEGAHAWLFAAADEIAASIRLIDS